VRWVTWLATCGRPHPREVESPCDSPAPIMAPRWIMGPSGPTGSPDATANIVEKNLTTRVAALNTLV